MSADRIERIGALPGVRSVTARDGALWAEAPALDVEAMAAGLAALGLRLAAMTATPLGPDGETDVVYHYVDDGPHREDSHGPAPAVPLVNIRTRTRNGHLPSLAPALRAASWAEREIQDLCAVEFSGHPDPAPLLRPAGVDSATLRAALCHR